MDISWPVTTMANGSIDNSVSKELQIDEHSWWLTDLTFHIGEAG